VRVTHLVFDLNGGGMESLVAAMAARFAGGPVVLSAVSLSGRPGRVGSSIRHLLDQYHVTRPVPGVSMLAPLGVARLVRETRPDVVHLHSGAWYKGALAARLASAPRVVYTEHGREHDDPALSRWLDRRASRWTDTVVAVSDRLARYLGEVVGVEERRIRTVPNGVDIDAFSPGFAPLALRRDLGIPEGAVVIGSVGRLEPVKRYDRLITALGRLRAPGMVERPVHLVLVGDGSRRAALEEQVRREGLSEAARLVGWTDRPADFYRLLDVFALTSDSEGASVSLMEAMACGIAPVVMDVGANAEILGPELADQVTPAGDLDVFVRTAAHMLCSPDRRQHAGRLARERVGRCYNLDRMLAWYEDLYRQRATAPASSAGGRT
jgi:glycosyltransferase involved in cell wall biosynthesis